jgi:hypothetical protein
MNWIQSEILEFIGMAVATLLLTLQLAPLFSHANQGLEDRSESDSLENSKTICKGIKNNKWRLVGIAIITTSLVAGVAQKNILFGLSICATLNYLLSVTDRSYMENAVGSHRFIANIIVGFYSSITFVLMIIFWHLSSKSR